MSAPLRLLDLFSGAGGAAEGYRRAGFTDITGVDVCPMPRYPFRFIQADALEFLAGVKPGEYDLIHASPPCQNYSRMRRGRWQDREHPDLVAAVRAALNALGTPYVIENVPGAPLIDPVMLCGTMFGLQTREGSQLRRHRLFEAPGLVALIPPCQHNRQPAEWVLASAINPDGRLSMKRRPATIGVWGNAGGHSHRDNLDHYGVNARREAMDIDWMTQSELSQAIPPAYTCWIGRQILGATR